MTRQIGPASSPRWLIDSDGATRPGLSQGLFAVGSLLLGFALIADEVIEGGTQRIDEAILGLFRGRAGPVGPSWLVEMVRDVTALGSFAGLGIVFFASVGYLLLLGKRALAGLMAAAVLGGVALSTLLKMAFDRPRPMVEVRRRSSRPASRAATP